MHKFTEKLCHVCNAKWRLMFAFGLSMLLFAFTVESPQNLGKGLLAIWRSPCQLTTDFIAVGGLAATLTNSSIIIFCNLLLFYILEIPVNGQLCGGMGIQAGFAFFGSHILNAFPIVMGGLIFAQIFHRDLEKNIFKILLGSSLGPFISYVALSDKFSRPFNYLLAIALGLLIGALILPVAESSLNFHRGYTLYNSGFTAGLIALILTGILRFFGCELEPVQRVCKGEGWPFAYVLLAFFLVLLGLSGYHAYKAGELARYKELLRHPGRSVDFDLLYSPALSGLNMALMGLICLAYVSILGGPWTGPVLGSLITVFGFAAMGKTPKNTLPILIAVPLVNYLATGMAVNSGILSVVFLGTSLAPLAGSYGFWAGLLGGAVHGAISSQLVPLQAGMNLYNNGFVSGLVAAALAPVFESLQRRRTQRKACSPHSQGTIDKSQA